MALSREFGLSRRQAYRYLQLARTGRPAPPVAENSITITLKMPESLAGDLRAHASKHDLTTSEVIRRAVAAFLAAKRRHVQRDNYDGRLPTIKLAKSGSRRVARRELPV